MHRFAALYAELDATTSTTAKVAAMRRYFEETPSEDAAWGLYFLLGHRLKRVIPPTRLRDWITQLTKLSPALVEDSYAHVGDLAETVALLLDARLDRPPHYDDAPPLHECVALLQALANADESLQRDTVFLWWNRLPFEQCFLFTKLLTGSLRVGVSAGLAARALAAQSGLETTIVQHRLMGDWKPSADFFAALTAPVQDELQAERQPSQPYPFCLAQALTDADLPALGEAAAFLVEWKWDGIRGQLIRREGQTYLWSRGEDLLNGRFPEIEILAEQLPDGCVLDGEILAWKDGLVSPFALLQTRIGRKAPGKKTLADAPVIFMPYDLLELRGEDMRARPLSERRAQLETLCATTSLVPSPRIEGLDWDALKLMQQQARERGVEGLMLKRLDSIYGSGRKTGLWWKWKIDPLTVDCVLVYAQAGHGRRSNLYTDYTLAVWDGDALVPVAKAYSGLTDAELVTMDRWIRAHTIDKFGPVRSVEALQVFEIAFEGIQLSPRHKSGVALRFPRIARWRKDKPASEADTLANLKQLIAPS
jgi:DNA ligase-1